MCVELDKYEGNLAALDSGMKTAGMGGVVDSLKMPLGDFLKLAAKNGLDLTAKCVRPKTDEKDHEGA